MAVNKYAIDAEIRGIDRITAPMMRMESAVTRTTNRMRTQWLKVDRAMGRVGKNMTTALGVGGAVGAIWGVGRAMGVVITQGAEFEQELTGAWARFGGTVEDGAKRAQKSYLALDEAARNTGARTEFTAVQAAGALNAMAKAGFKANDALGLLDLTVDFATASSQNLDTAVQIAVSSLGAFGLRVEATNDPLADTAKLTANMTRMMDVMAKTANTSNTDLGLMFETIRKGAPAATATGASLKELAAFTGAVANAGLIGADAGTAMKNVWLKLADQTVIKKLASAGIGSFEIGPDGMRRGRSFTKMIGDLADRLEGLSEKETAAKVNELFGLRGVTAVTNVLAQGIRSFKSYTEEIDRSEKSMSKLANILRATRQGDIRMLQSAIQAVTLEFSTANHEGIGETIRGLTSMTRSIRDFFGENPALARMTFEMGALGLATLVVAGLLALVGAAVSAIGLSVPGVFTLWTGALLGLAVVVERHILPVLEKAGGLINDLPDPASLIRERFPGLPGPRSFGTPRSEEQQQAAQQAADARARGPAVFDRMEAAFQSSETINKIELFIKGASDLFDLNGADDLPPGILVSTSSGEGV